MDDKGFIFTDELTKRMLRLRFDNDQLFRSKKHPWLEFYNMLMENDFPPEVTISQVRKKWSYIWDSYKIAKKEKNKNWKYYKIFEKHYGKTMALDKYESSMLKPVKKDSHRPDNWRLKLITCISEAKEHDIEQQGTLWRNVEKAMRSQDLPEDCCIQDMQGLWHHLKMIFRRKHRKKLKQSDQDCDWPLYSIMLEYLGRYEPEFLVQLQSEGEPYIVIPSNQKGSKKQGAESGENDHEFQWTKDITESFIQVRLQNDWLFCERGQAWREFTVVMRQEHGFPDSLTSREACRKWACMYGEYQKAKATGNKSWLYYNLFELYLGEGSLSMNPLLDWQEKWALNLIQVRTSLEYHFVDNKKDPSKSWREVEKRLRHNGIPLDHSLLDLPYIWSYLMRTYKWKRKFANKGVLKEQWFYFEPMTKYMEICVKSTKRSNQKRAKKESMDFDDTGNDDCEDDMKLFDLKQKMELDLKPSCEFLDKQCRACAGVGDCVDIFEHKDDEGIDVASKMLIICGVEVKKAENIPTQICYNCLQELENAYKFRRKCQTTNEQFRDYSKNIKIEILERNDPNPAMINDDDDMTHCDMDDTAKTEDIHVSEVPKKPIISKNNTKKEVAKKKKYKYVYWKVCEICGVHTKNLKNHVDVHNETKLYACDICGKSFKFKNCLFTHKATHNPTPKTSCEVCGKKFYVMAHYRRHMAYHTNERKYGCDLCDKRFNSSEILKVHRRIHNDERPFDCSECGKTFRTTGCVSRHKRIVHGITRKVQ